MKKLIAFASMVGILFGIGHTINSQENKVTKHCEICDNTEFESSKKMTFFSLPEKDGELSVVHSGSFLKCTHCGAFSN